MCDGRNAILQRRQRAGSPVIDRADGLKSPEAVSFTKQTKALCEFMEMADSVLSKVVRSEQSSMVPWALKFLK